jgi:hypothetical protein
VVNQRISVELEEVITSLRRPGNILLRLKAIHRPANEGDDIYQVAINELFHEETEPLMVIKWKAIYEKLEAAIDRGEKVASIVESVVVKYA